MSGVLSRRDQSHVKVAMLSVLSTATFYMTLKRGISLDRQSIAWYSLYKSTDIDIVNGREFIESVNSQKDDR